MTNSLDTIRKLLTFDYLMLLPVLALAFYIAFIPHSSYLYPVHIDEWLHLACSKEIIKETSAMVLTDPFLGGAPVGNQLYEVGFHLFWAIFHQISGISWLTIFRYFPSIIFMFTILSVYILARREGFGWEAAFFTCLIPTTVGILGPAFMVPVAMGLVFIPLAIFLAFNFRNVWSYLTVFIFICFLLSIHAPSAISLVIILAPYILLNVKDNLKHSLGLTLALITPFLVSLLWMFNAVLPRVMAVLAPQLLPAYVDFPRIIVTYGYLPVLFCLLGVAALALKGGRKNYGLTLGLLAMLLILAVFYTLHYGVSTVYERGLMFMMLMLGVVAGAGLMWVKELRLPEGLVARLKAPLVRQNIGKALCLALVGLTLVIAIPARQSIPYYRMIDGYDYEAFVWIRDNISDDYEKAVLDPWKATAFVAITGRKVVTRIHEYPKSSDNEAYAFLNGGCSDTSFLRGNGISIVYSRSPCSNPDLTEARESIYLLRE